MTLTTAVERWGMENGVILAAPVYCELCLCTCMVPQTESEQNYFDLQETVADVANGYIISALKFVKEGRVIRLAVSVHGTQAQTSRTPIVMLLISG